MAMRDLGSRLSPNSISASMLALYGAMTFVVIGLVMMWFEGAKVPSLEAAGYLLAMILLASSGSYYTTKAVRLGGNVGH